MIWSDCGKKWSGGILLFLGLSLPLQTSDADHPHLLTAAGRKLATSVIDGTITTTHVSAIIVTGAATAAQDRGMVGILGVVGTNLVAMGRSGDRETKSPGNTTTGRPRQQTTRRT